MTSWIHIFNGLKIFEIVIKSFFFWDSILESVFSEDLKSIGINLMSQGYCTDHSFWEIEYGYMCAGLSPNDSTPMKGWKHVTAGGKGTCQGDFGAPLICDIDGTATFIGINSAGDLTECGMAGKPAIHLSVEEATDWMKYIINQYSPPKMCFELQTDPSIKDSLGDKIKLFQNGDEVGLALDSYQQSNNICIDDTSDGDKFEFKNDGKNNVSNQLFLTPLSMSQMRHKYKELIKTRNDEAYVAFDFSFSFL